MSRGAASARLHLTRAALGDHARSLLLQRPRGGTLFRDRVKPFIQAGLIDTAEEPEDYTNGVVSSYKESCNNKPIYGYMLPNLSPSPNLYKVQSVYNNNVAL